MILYFLFQQLVVPIITGKDAIYMEDNEEFSQGLIGSKGLSIIIDRNDL